MEIALSPAQEEYIQLGVASGRYATPETAVGEALMQWEERQRQRLEILSAIDISRAEFERGDFREVSSRQEAADFARTISERGAARLSRLSPRK